MQGPGGFDPRVDDITVAHLIGHRGGWDIARTGRDPTFDLRGVARALGLHAPPTKQDFARYMHGQPLQFAPGSEEHYSNTGYTLLGLVIEKLLRTDYVSALRRGVTEPQQLGPVFLARTRPEQRLAGEAVYDQPGSMPSQLVVDREVPAPPAYGGELIYEIVDSSGGLVTTAATVVRLISRYAVWGLGGRAPGYARSGSMGGTSSWAASRPDGLDFCCILNTRDFGGAPDPMPALVAGLNRALDGVAAG
jgi:CubicO group peptidase (beta-lactamase class C family)